MRGSGADSVLRGTVVVIIVIMIIVVVMIVIMIIVVVIIVIIMRPGPSPTGTNFTYAKFRPTFSMGKTMLSINDIIIGVDNHSDSSSCSSSSISHPRADARAPNRVSADYDHQLSRQWNQDPWAGYINM